MKFLIATDKGPQEVDALGRTYMTVGAGTHAGWRMDAFVWICGPEIRVSELTTGFNLVRIPMAMADGGDIEALVDSMTDQQYSDLCDRIIQAGSIAAFHRFEDATDETIAQAKAAIARWPVLNYPEGETPSVTH